MFAQSIKVAVTCFVLAVPLAGCGGGGAETSQNIRTTTTGQELTDLKNAYDAGAITQEEYEEEREEILDGG